MEEIKVGKVAMTTLKSITIKDRTRKEFGDLNGLEKSIKESGLIQPLAVKDNGDGTFTLLGGERRYLILQKNNVEIIPIRIFPSNIDKYQMKSIELAENLYRKDFEYWEHDNLVRETHELQQSIYGEKAPGPNSTGWGTDDTGKLIGVSKSSISTAVKRAEVRDAFPALFTGCKTQKDASKVIKKMDEAVVKETIAEKLELESPNTILSKLSKCYILGDCIEGIKKLPDSVFHLVEIDPPYAIKLKEAKKKLNYNTEILYNDNDYNEIDASQYQKFIAELFSECYRTMAANS